MRTPSGLSSHGSELTSHYCKYNAEERISLSAGHIKNKSSNSNTLLLPFYLVVFFSFLLMKYHMLQKKKTPSSYLIPTQL